MTYLVKNYCARKENGAPPTPIKGWVFAPDYVYEQIARGD